MTCLKSNGLGSCNHGREDVGSDQLALSLMMTSTEIRCGQVNLTRHRLSCNVLNEEDERNMVCRSGQQNSVSVSLCPDGSLNKTCFPVTASNSLYYKCLCHTAHHHQVDHGITATWSPWQMLNVSFRQFTFTRKLHSDAVAGFLVQEYETDPGIPEIVNIISNYGLSDSIFSASTFYASEYEPHRARIDAYFSHSCGWVAGDYTLPWLQIHLPSCFFVITGVLIKQRCDSPNQYVTAFSVKTSEEDLQWQDVITNTYIESLYGAFDGLHSVTVWFPRSYTTPIWRIYINSYNNYPAMKCDFKGYGNQIV